MCSLGDNSASFCLQATPEMRKQLPWEWQSFSPGEPQQTSDLGQTSPTAPGRGHQLVTSSVWEVMDQPGRTRRTDGTRVNSALSWQIRETTNWAARGLGPEGRSYQCPLLRAGIPCSCPAPKPPAPPRARECGRNTQEMWQGTLRGQGMAEGSGL